MADKYVIDTCICVDLSHALIAMSKGFDITSDTQKRALELFALHNQKKLELVITPQVYHEWIIKGHEVLKNSSSIGDMKRTDQQLLKKFKVITLDDLQTRLAPIIANKYLEDMENSGLINRGKQITAINPTRTDSTESDKYENKGDSLIFSQASMHRLPIITENVKDFLPEYQSTKLKSMEGYQRERIYANRSFNNAGVDNINEQNIKPAIAKGHLPVNESRIYHPSAIIRAFKNDIPVANIPAQSVV